MWASFFFPQAHMIASHSTLCKQYVAMGTMTSVRPCDFIHHSGEKKKPLTASGLWFLSCRESFVWVQRAGGQRWECCFLSHLTLNPFAKHVPQNDLRLQDEHRTFVCTTYSHEIPSLLMACHILTQDHNFPAQNLQWMGLSWWTCNIQFWDQIWDNLRCIFPQCVSKKNSLSVWKSDYYLSNVKTRRGMPQ